MSPCLKWEGDYVNEGPLVLKHEGTYVLTYSAIGYHEPGLLHWLCNGEFAAGTVDEACKGADFVSHANGIGAPGIIASSILRITKSCSLPITRTNFLDHPGPPRQLAIDRVKWIHGPDSGHGGRPGHRHAAAHAVWIKAARCAAQSDDFSAAALDRQRWTVFNENPRYWKLADGADDPHRRRRCL